MVIKMGTSLFSGFVVSSLCDTELTATYFAMGSFLPVLMLCGKFISSETFFHLLRFCKFQSYSYKTHIVGCRFLAVHEHINGNMW
jgi:hypothetical protein